MARTAHHPFVEPIELELDGALLTGLRAKPPGAPSGLVVALHGGGYDARYWHHPGFDSGSLLLLGADLGFEVIALDRPGYAGSAATFPLGDTLAAQADLVFAAIAAADAGRRLPTFLIGHSMGGILSLMMAASDRSGALSGVDVSGVPLVYGDERFATMRARLDPLIASGATHLPLNPPEALRTMFFGPEGSYDPRFVAGGDTEHPVPTAELPDALEAPERLPAILELIKAPVQWTIAESENSSEAGEHILLLAASLLRNSRRAITQVQSFSGHNISLHWVARAYHLRAFAFFEECLVGQSRAL